MAKQTTWYRLDPAELLIEALECSPKEWYRRTIVLAKALVKGERGKDAFADRLIDDADEYIEQRRNAGRISGISRKSESKHSERNANETRTESQFRSNETATKRERNTNEPTNETPTERERNANEGTKPVRPTRARPTDRTDRPTEQTEPNKPNRPTEPTEPRTPCPLPPGATCQEHPGEAEDGRTDGSEEKSQGTATGGKHPVFDSPEWASAFGGDKYGTMARLDGALLPEFAAWYCREAGNRRAVMRYGGFCNRRGVEAFRRIVEEFVGEVESGEEPNDRGRAFMARVMQAEGAS